MTSHQPTSFDRVFELGTRVWSLSSRAVLIAGATTSLLGCQGLWAPPSSETVPETPGPRQPNGKRSACELLTPPAASVCGGQRRITRSANGECPERGSLTGHLLGPEAPLNGYCVYDRGARDWSADAWQGRGRDWVGDCPVRIQEIRADLRPWYEGFTAGVGQLAGWPKGAESNPVQVAVLDTAGPVTANGTSNHGPMVAAIVRDVASACVEGFERVGGPSCSKSDRVVRTYSALPWSDSGGTPKRDTVGGGYYGYASDVAVAIDEALRAWKGGTPERLILNLSLAWPEQAGMPPQLDPAFQMLKLAACRGALIVAAAGNQLPYTCDARLAPASWADELVSCEEGTVPLLHAVGGVDHAHRPLLSTPRLMRPRLLALGSQAIANVPGRSVEPMTGSSVSTAVVSGIAASVWSASPGLEASAVMDIVWQSGTPVSPTTMANLYFGSTAPEQRVVSACAALTSVLGTSPGCVPSTPSPPVVPSGSIAATVNLTGESLTTPCSVCEREASVSTSIPAFPVDPVATPQPDDNACPACQIDGYTAGSAQDASANLQLSDAYADRVNNGDILGAVIRIYDSSGASESHYYTQSQLQLTHLSMTSYVDPALNWVGDVAGGPPGTLPTNGWIDIYYVDANGRTVVDGNELPVIP